MAGVLVAVVGPSGAGKDSLIAAARRALAGDPRFVFVRRVVTRPEGGNEDHDTLAPEDFSAAAEAGAFCLHWGAHGLFYGIPASASAEVEAGRIAVANLSRAALDEARCRFPRLVTLVVTAPPAVLAARLAGRGRESRSAIEARLAAAEKPVEGGEVVVIDNGGQLEDAVDRFLEQLRALHTESSR